MRTLFYSVLTLLAACSGPASQPPATQVPLPVVLHVTPTPRPLPAHATTYIQQHFPDWYICSQDDYDDAFGSFYDTTTHPWYVEVDINDDQQGDYGVLIRNQHQVKVLFLVGEDSSFTHWLAPNISLPFNAANPRLQHGLFPEPPGQIDVAYPSLQSLVLHTNGVSLVHLENRICLYYKDSTGIAIFKTR